MPESRKYRDWIPTNEQGQLDLMARWLDVLGNPSKQTDYAWPSDECSDVITAIVRYQSARSAYVEDNSSGNLTAKNERKVEAIHLMREFAAGHVRPSKKVPQEQKEFLGLPRRDSTKSRVETPKYPPHYSMSNHGYLIIRFEIREGDAVSFFIPAGYNGAVCHFALADEPITDVRLLVRSVLFNTAIYDFQLPPEAEGKILSCSLEWETSSNLHGPQSPIQSIRVR